MYSSVLIDKLADRCALTMLGIGHPPVGDELITLSSADEVVALATAASLSPAGSWAPGLATLLEIRHRPKMVLHGPGSHDSVERRPQPRT